MRERYQGHLKERKKPLIYSSSASQSEVVYPNASGLKVGLNVTAERSIRDIVRVSTLFGAH